MASSATAVPTASPVASCGGGAFPAAAPTTPGSLAGGSDWRAASPGGPAVTVSCRVRPRLPLADAASGAPSLSVNGETIVCASGGPNAERVNAFTFDNIYGEHAAQEAVFAAVAAPLVTHIMAGINATIIAYGQTGEEGSQGSQSKVLRQGTADLNILVHYYTFLPA